MKKLLILSGLFFFLFAFSAELFSQRITNIVYVAQERPEGYEGPIHFNSIRQAVAESPDNTMIIVLDNAVYAERVEFNNRRNVHLVSQSWLDAVDGDFSSAVNLRTKPTIRFADRQNIGPRNTAESQQEELAGQFQRNGVIAILGSSNITVEGFNIDGAEGRGGWNFLHPGVWPETPGGPGMHPVAHGNGGIAVQASRRVIIRGNHIHNAYWGMYFVDRTINDIFTMTNPGDASDAAIQVPLSNIGQSGNHLIEKNHIFDNSFGIGVEINWGLGSTVRHNLIYNNFANVVQDNHRGGAFRIKDVVVAPWLIYNNTFYRNGLILQHVWWRGGTTWYFSSNIFGEGSHIFGVGGDANQSGQMDLLNSIPAQYNNMWQPQFGLIDGQFANWMSPPRYVFHSANQFLASTQLNSFQAAGQSFEDQVLRWTNNNGFVDLTNNNNRMLISRYRAQNATTATVFKELFVSRDRTSPDFLFVNYEDEFIRTSINNASRPEDGVRDRDGAIADVGALTRLYDGTGARDWTGQFRGARLTIVDGIYVPIQGTTATLTFPLIVEGGLSADIDQSTLRFESILYYHSMPYLPPGNNTAFPTTSLPAPSVITVAEQPRLGGNSLTFQVPVAPGVFALFNVVVSAVDRVTGQRVYSNIGVFPHRNRTHFIDGTANPVTNLNVEFLDLNTRTPISSITVDEPLIMRVTVAGGGSFDIPYGQLNLNDISGRPIFNEAGSQISVWPTPFTTATTETVVRFQTLGGHVVTASGFRGTGAGRITAIGVSPVLMVRSAGPEYVQFVSPVSSSNPAHPFNGNAQNVLAIPANSIMRDILIQAFDRFGNPIVEMPPDEPWYATIRSGDVNIMRVITPSVLISADGTALVTVEMTGRFDPDLPPDQQPQTRLFAMIEGSEHEDFINVRVGRPRHEILMQPLVGTLDTARSYVGEMIPVRIFLTLDRENVFEGAENSVISFNEHPNFRFFRDPEGTEEILPGQQFELVGNEAIVYVTASRANLPNGQTFGATIESSLATRVNMFRPLFFEEIPITNLFITWVPMDTNFRANRDTMFTITQGSFMLYAVGVTRDGQLRSVPSTEWGGLGAFDILHDFGDTLIVTLSADNEGVGRIYAFVGDIIDTTGNITVIDNIHRVYVLRRQHWTGQPIDTANALTPETEINYYLGTRMEFVTIGVDTTDAANHVVVPVHTTWQPSTLPDSARHIITARARPDTLFALALGINEVAALGDAQIHTVYRREPGKERTININILDPITEIISRVPADLRDQRRSLTSGNDGDTVTVEHNIIRRNGDRLILATFFDMDPARAPEFSEWLDTGIVELAVVITGSSVSGLSLFPQSDTARISAVVTCPEPDVVVFTVSRNGVEYSFVVNLTDIIDTGIYPNPVLASLFGEPGRVPVVRVLVHGQVLDIKMSIFDARGNLVRVLSGLENDGGDFRLEVAEEASEGADTANGGAGAVPGAGEGEEEGGVSRVFQVYTTQAWDGKNNNGRYINTGTYILYFDIRHVGSDNTETTVRTYVPFFYINNIQSTAGN